jgi:16S rRNA (adenine1518-N6/adenine1519-N6)-dimethyltransferase
MAKADLPFAKKGLGQHWLTDKAALQDIAEAAQAGEGDTVLEIGPGLGTLTNELLATGAHVTALEFDQDLIKNLEKKYKDTNVTVMEGDIRGFDFGQLPLNYKIVANIPYYLTANLFRALIDTDHKPAIASLLVQKEVAERVTAKPGKLSFVAVALQLFYEVKPGALVPSYLFTPPPKVDSQVLILEKRTEPLLPGLDVEKFFAVVKAGFSERRKKLKTSLKTGVDSAVQVNDILIKAKISPDARAQELTLEEWHRIYLALEN